jgi:voltage-gated potassium channel
MDIAKKTLAYAIALAAVLLYGTVGTYVLGRSGNFNVHVGSWLQALYFTIVTMSTVGYGDITPITNAGMTFTIILIIAGLSIFISAITVLSGELLGSRFEKIYSGISSLDRKKLNNHIVLIGYDSINIMLAERLRKSGKNFVIITADKTVADSLREKGYKAFVADYTIKSDMEKFQIDRAEHIVIDLRDSSKTVYVVLVVRKLAKEAEVSVVAPTSEVEMHLQELNIDHIINPITVGTDMLSGILMRKRRKG